MQMLKSPQVSKMPTLTYNWVSNIVGKNAMPSFVES